MSRLIKSTRNKMKLVDDLNYVYDKHKVNIDGSKQYWMCENRLCKARIHTKTLNDEYEITKTVNEHNHSSTAGTVQAKLVLNKMKQKSVASQQSTRDIVSTEVSSITESAKAELPIISSMSRNVRRWRQSESGSPAIPQERHGYPIPDRFRKLDSGLKFLQYDSGEDDIERILIFATDAAIKELKESSGWAGDGTFKCCPSIYYQMYTLHIQKCNFTVPRLFALLPDKTQNTYNRLFTKIKELVDDAQPEILMMDYEKAAINAFSENFRNTTITCCLFHLSQNMYKKIVEFGFRERYHHDDEFNLKIRCFPALGFLPIDDVVDGFEQLADDDDLPQEIVSYFETYYIGCERGRGQHRRRIEPMFPISLWNVHTRALNGMPRTNNNVEGFHNALKSSITNVHPNLWCLIIALKKEEGLSSAKIAQITAELLSQRRRNTGIWINASKR